MDPGRAGDWQRQFQRARASAEDWALQVGKLRVLRVPRNVGILWETSCNNVGNSEQNEQMKKHRSVRAIMNKLLKMLVFRKEMGVEHP